MHLIFRRLVKKTRVLFERSLLADCGFDSALKTESFKESLILHLIIIYRVIFMHHVKI